MDFRDVIKDNRNLIRKNFDGKDVDIRERNRNTKSNKLPINPVDKPVLVSYDVKDMVKTSHNKNRRNKSNNPHIKDMYKNFNYY